MKAIAKPAIKHAVLSKLPILGHVIGKVAGVAAGTAGAAAGIAAGAVGVAAGAAGAAVGVAAGAIGAGSAILGPLAPLALIPGVGSAIKKGVEAVGNFFKKIFGGW